VYHLKTGNMQVEFLPFTISPAYCSPVSYNIYLSNGEALPSFIQFDQASRTLTVGATETSAVGLYTIIINGTYFNNGYNISASIKWNLEVKYIP